MRGLRLALALPLLFPLGALADGHLAVEEAAITPHRRFALQSWAGISRNGSDFWISPVYSPFHNLEITLAFGSDAPGTYDARYRVAQAKTMLLDREGAPAIALSAGLNMNHWHFDDYFVNLPISWQAAERLNLHVNFGYRWHLHEEEERGLTAGVRGDLALSDRTSLIGMASFQPGIPALIQAGHRWTFNEGRTMLDVTFGQEMARRSPVRIWFAIAHEF
jgi:hypothetical protein